MKELCEIWTDEQLDLFLEEHKDVDTLNTGITTYPVKEWAEKVKRNILKSFSNK